MSGPIVRKYGFPNFDKIFGERELKHGVDEGEEVSAEGADASRSQPAASAAEKPKKPARKAKKKT